LLMDNIDSVYNELERISNFDVPDEIYNGDVEISNITRTGIDFGNIQDGLMHSIITYNFIIIDKTNATDSIVAVNIPIEHNIEF